MILSTAMMLRWSFGMQIEAERIERAVDAVLNDGLRCGDIKQPGTTVLGTREMAQAVIERLHIAAPASQTH
jgi:3-isopropylmalate dehydrogenase